jgi:hypothetical protein
MSHKKKSGLQRGLSDIVEKQTAPKQDASELSRGLIGKFTEPKPTMGTLGTQSTQGTQRVHPAPMRDFQKVANSITREAVPAGVFKGKCKQIYDFLYSKTRGAIVPSRSVTLTRQAIMEGSHVGSSKTLFLNLRHLRSTGLISWTECEGTHGGNEYTVYLPEEVVNIQGTQGTLGTLGTQSTPSHFLPRVPWVETTQGTQGLSPELSTVTSDPNTLIKDKERIDDEAAPLGELFRELEREVIGKNSASLQQWQDLRELLVTELKIAAARTTISNVPAFLTEHLRRRLWKVDKKRATEIAAAEKGNQAQAVDEKEKRKCPDCAGTGFWYPDGPDKGVTRCTHLKLPAGSPVKETD